MGKYTVYFEDFHGQLKTKAVNASGGTSAGRKFLTWAKKQKRGDMMDVTVVATKKE